MPTTEKAETNLPTGATEAAKIGIGADAHCSESGILKTNAMKTLSVHKALSLPSRYRIFKSVAGNVALKGRSKWIELRMMRTDTHGQRPAYAMLEDGAWHEISADGFEAFARLIILGDPKGGAQ